MNWVNSEKEIFNEALKAVEKTNQSLIRVYLLTQKEIEAELKQFYISVDPSWTKQYQAARLTAVFKSISIRLNALTGISIKSIEQAFLRVYQDTFNNYAYNFSSYYAKPGAFPLLPFMVNPEKTIKAALNEKIGEYSFMKSMAEKQGILRDSLREQIAIAIAKGESTAKLTARLKDVFDSGISRYAATARTEMLKAFSIAQEESFAQAEEIGVELSPPLWLGRNDGREREAHIALNNTYAKKENDGKYYFRGGGCKGVAPRLFTGVKSAAMNVQCRCRSIRTPLKLDPNEPIKLKDGIPDLEHYINLIS